MSSRPCGGTSHSHSHQDPQQHYSLQSSPPPLNKERYRPLYPVLPSFLASFLRCLLISFNTMFLDPESLSWFLMSFPLEDRNTLQIASQEHANKHKIHQHLNMESGRGTDFPTIAVVNGSTIHLNGFITLQNNAKQGEVVGGCGRQTRSSDYEHKRITKGVDEWKFIVANVQPSITGRLGLQIFTRQRPPASNPFSCPRLGSGTLHLCSNGCLQNSAANDDGRCLTWVKFGGMKSDWFFPEKRLMKFQWWVRSVECRVPIATRDLKNDAQEHSKRGLNICPCQSKRRTQTSKLKNLSYHILSYFIPCIIYFPPRNASNPTQNATT